MVKTLLIVCTIFLLVACSGTAPVVQPTTSATAEPTALPSPPPPTVPVATATTAPTATATVAPTVARAPGLRVAVQTADNSVKLFALDGSSRVLANATARLNRLYWDSVSNAISTTVYAQSTAVPSSIVTVDSTGVRPVAAFKTAPTSVVTSEAGGGRLAWGTSVVTGTAMTAELLIGARDGSQPKNIAKKTFTTAPAFRAIQPVRFSQDGTRLYYSYEPVGLGGYILFGGATDLWEYVISTGKSTQLVKEKQFGAMTCIDDLAPNDKLVAYHCSEKGIGVFDLRTSKSSSITLPTTVAQAKALGNVRFSPDSTRVAFAAARSNADDEQGWVLVSSGLSGASKVIATSAAKDYYELIAWANADTLLLQTHNPQPAVWTVRADGSGLAKLADGQFLSLLANAP